MIEVGAAMQNAYRYGAELGVATRAIGRVADAAAHADDVKPVLAIVLGR